MLRDERNRLKEQVTDLTEKLNALQERLAPVKDLNSKIEGLVVDKQSLTQELQKWKQRAGQLAERCKFSPEESRRLTAERDGLSKQLQEEKAGKVKVEEALIKLKQDNTAIENQLVELRKQQQIEAISVSTSDKFPAE